MMVPNYGKCCLLLSFIIILLPSCESPSAINVDEVIQEKVAERLAVFKAVVNKNCLERAQEEAGLIADSIILERARHLRDTAFRPFRPFRPDQPVLKKLEDSLVLGPLFDSIYLPLDTLVSPVDSIELD